MAARRKLYARISADLRHHPKVVSSAKSLDIPKVYVIGHLISMWLGALEFAEDGDLWRGDDESSLRFFESLAEIPGDTTRFLEVFRRDRWLDGWLIHDWLDYTGDLLVARYSSHNRPLLVAIYQKHNRVYGRETEGVPDLPHPDGAHGKLLGSDREVGGNKPGSSGNQSDLPVTPSPKPQALNPITQKVKEKVTLNPLTPETQEKRSPMRGMGGSSPPTSSGKPRAFSEILKEGSWEPGYPVTQSQLTGDGLSHKDVFEAFLPLLVAHGILSLEAFYERVHRSKASPAAWMMLYLDKIHAVYRTRNGTTLLDEDADPVGMTMAGLLPGRNKRRHHHTEAARSLFLEIMMDHDKAKKGKRPKWLGKLSGQSVVLELERRKGKAGKIE